MFQIITRKGCETKIENNHWCLCVGHEPFSRLLFKTCAIPPAISRAAAILTASPIYGKQLEYDPCKESSNAILY